METTEGTHDKEQNQVTDSGVVDGNVGNEGVDDEENERNSGQKSGRRMINAHLEKKWGSGESIGLLTRDCPIVMAHGDLPRKMRPVNAITARTRKMIETMY